MSVSMRYKPDAKLEELTEPGDFTYSAPTEPKQHRTLYYNNPMCTRFANRLCFITVVCGAPDNPAHGWDGNLAQPTVQPSIGCETRRCEFHGFIQKGVITK